MKKFIQKFSAIWMTLKRLGRRPALDWYFLLSFITILFIVAVVLAGFLHYRLILENSAPVTPVNDNPLIFDREAVDKALERMNQSDENAKNLPPSVLADPS